MDHEVRRSAARPGHPNLGFGVGLCTAHFAHFLERWPAVDSSAGVGSGHTAGSGGWRQSWPETESSGPGARPRTTSPNGRFAPVWTPWPRRCCASNLG